MNPEEIKTIPLTELGNALKGHILQVDTYTFVRVESLSYNPFPKDSPEYENFIRYLYIKGSVIRVHTYLGEHRADLTAYKATYVNLSTKEPIPNYTPANLLHEITQSYPLVENLDELKARLFNAKLLIDGTIANFFTE